MKALAGINLLLLSFLIVLLSTSAFEPEPPAEGPAPGNLPQIIYSVDMNRDYDFAGERVPIEIDDVRERLDRELLVNSYWHSTTILHIKTAYRYFPVFEQILAEEGVPDDFKYLAVAESSLNNATSPAGAKGIWQFMTRTAEAYGLEINSEVDERYHVEKATRAACAYLKDYYKDFGSWTLSAASYNVGGPSMRREMTRQKESSYYDMNINSETNRYVFRIVAIKEILSSPERFGFYIEEHEKYDPHAQFYTVEITESVESLADLAHAHGITYRELKVHNPWLLSYKLSVRPGQSYEIKIPKGIRD